MKIADPIFLETSLTSANIVPFNFRKEHYAHEKRAKVCVCMRDDGLFDELQWHSFFGKEWIRESFNYAQLDLGANLRISIFGPPRRFMLAYQFLRTIST